MADLDIEKKIPPVFDIKGIDLSKVNPAGQEIPEISQAHQESIQAQENLMKALEERYKKINYFKLAEAFAKPQLGGFLASLGSAAGVMGEQAEAERAIQPTIAKMRADIATQKANLTQRTVQERLLRQYEEDIKAGKPQNLDQLRQIISLAPDSPVAKSLETKIGALQPERRQETKFGIDIQKDFKKDPTLILSDPTYKGVVRSDEDAERYKEGVNNGRPMGISQAVWNNMTFPEREAAIAKQASIQIEQGMEEGQKYAVRAEAAHDVLDELTSLRSYATDPSLKPVFSVLATGDLFSQFRAFLDKNPGRLNDAMEGLVNATMDKLKNKDPVVRAKFDALVKGIAEVEMRLRGSLNNPTDAATELSRMRSPSLANSQAGFLKIIDVLGLNAFRDIEMNNLRYKKGLTQAELLPTSDMRMFRNETRRLREDLARTNPLESAPSWFYPNQNKPAAPEAEPVAPPTAKISADSASTTAEPSRAPSTSAKDKSSNKPPKLRENERIFNNEVWVRQPNGSYTKKAQ